MNISIVMPAYNEERNIEATVRKCHAVLSSIPGESEIVVTNDGSKDKTLQILENLAQELKIVNIVSHDPNQGYGFSLARAISHSKGDIVVTIDSDGQFDVSELPMLIQQFHGDLLTGYRKKKKDTLLRIFADRAMNLMIRIMFNIKFKDTNCAFKLIKGDVIRRLNLEARGFQIPTEIVIKMNAMGYKVEEAPVNHFPRPAGNSALAPLKTAIHMFVFLCYLRMKKTLYRMKVLHKL